MEWWTTAGLPGRKATPVMKESVASAGSTRKQR
jgi:hypothetical protein